MSMANIGRVSGDQEVALKQNLTTYKLLVQLVNSLVTISCTPDVNVTDRAARLLGIVYGNLAQLQQSNQLQLQPV